MFNFPGLIVGMWLLLVFLQLVLPLVIFAVYSAWRAVSLVRGHLSGKDEDEHFVIEKRSYSKA